MRERVLSVTQLNDYVKGVFEDELVLHDLSVVGEVYEYKATASATFITLKEGDGILNCVGFDSRYDCKAGDKVTLFGSVTFYGRTGRISFVFKSLKRAGEGDLLKEFNLLKEKLKLDGVFDNKKQIVAPISKVAVITGETGVVIHDFIKTVHRKRKFTDINLYYAAVQGKTAAGELTERLKEADISNADVIVIMRGGGSGDDLSVFNDETLVRALAACRKPVISAVGHETDFTLCDFAASQRAGTPSMAGELISRLNEDFFDAFTYVIQKIDTSMQAVLNSKTRALHRKSELLTYKSELKLEKVSEKINKISSDMYNCASLKYKNGISAVKALALKMNFSLDNAQLTAQSKLKSAVAGAEANNPLRILSLGYAKLTDSNGKNLDYSAVKAGDNIKAVTSDGTLCANVTKKIPTAIYKEK